MDAFRLAQIIDHTLLKPEATLSQIKNLCEDAQKYHFYSVCVQPHYVASAKAFLKDSSVKVCTVVGFPLGANTTATKVFETQNALSLGADEIDMVVSIGAVKNQDWDYVKSDIAHVVRSASPHLVKVILETALLTNEEIVKVCELAVEAQAHFVKTSTGFSISGAQVDHVKLMRQTVGENCGVKASGGIKDYDTALRMIDAGANRLGLSASVDIVHKKSAPVLGY